MARVMPSLARDLPQEEGGHQNILSEDYTFVGVAGDVPNEPELAALVPETLKTVGAPSDDDDDLSCPICLEEDDAAAWKETPCGHRFHGRCVERWLQEKESCPMCRREVLTMPNAATADCTAEFVDFMWMASLGFHVFGGVPIDDTDSDDDDA
ncbi:E3 ubiquitin-protein ligase EL5-like [Hordeum vulgare subsp. vulgare]|uniref:E3 ubiquitin-protein ligase EL5-like n=1 Tax=Hordeum vulgare subsp. vulgare TaxID=112509 RepID=UPI001D1A39B4|nr:E3 ubiquitin-protein ligase EL5-like [Hordeum vulgare subsp. vulgare]